MTSFICAASSSGTCTSHLLFYRTNRTKLSVHPLSNRCLRPPSPGLGALPELQPVPGQPAGLRAGPAPAAGLEVTATGSDGQQSGTRCHWAPLPVAAVRSGRVLQM